MEMAGFVVLVLGNLIYNQVIKLPCKEEEVGEEGKYVQLEEQQH